MKPTALLVLLCLSAPTALAAGMASPVASELPSTLTRSGHQFVAHCSDEDFARAKFPQKLARKCTSLLHTWRAEAAGRGNGIGPPGSGINPVGATLVVPFVPPPPPPPSRRS